MMGTIQSMLLLCWRVTKLTEENKATMGMIGISKAWLTLRGREVCALGR